MSPRTNKTIRIALVLASICAAAAMALPRSSAGRPGGGRVDAGNGSDGWLAVHYGNLVDRRRLTHSGESVGTLLDRLEGRPVPAPGERPADALAHQLLDPLLEPYAFVLPDALDSVEPAPSPAMVELGRLWPEGETQPAWVELLRARRYVVESDGRGRMRVFLPVDGPDRWSSGGPSGPPEASPAEAARKGWEAAWPVLRHVLAAEMRRRANAEHAGDASPALQVEVHAYRHLPARSTFFLGRKGWVTRVKDTRPRGDRPVVDLAAWKAFLSSGLQLEGARLDPDGTLRLLGSRVDAPPSILGRPLALSDFAVAYRAVFHGGLAEPYMSLDRSPWPQVSQVNYGGRLRDTSLGWVSLMCDIRFKTFSQGIDVARGADIREEVRRAVPGFRTHMERFASDPAAGAVLGQQTRLWFYPDDVDLTLSASGDLVVLRKVRMTAASERVREGTWTASRREDPPWTRSTIQAINHDYDALAGLFPELADLDQVVRLLSLFTWLRQAEADGLPVPDLDALMALDLPALPTPRRFPQLLAFNAFPPSGEEGPVDVVERAEVAAALDRLIPRSGRPLPAAARLERAAAALDRRLEDHRKLAEELDRYDRSKLDDSKRDLLAFRAERLRMHQLVLSTLPRDARARLRKRAAGAGGKRPRVFSVGIGGLDLGMGKALARASGRNRRVSWGSGSVVRVAGSPTRGTGEAAHARARSRGPRPEWRHDPEGLPSTVVPAHGEDADDVIRGAWKEPEGKEIAWVLVLEDRFGPGATARRLVLDGKGRARLVERVEERRRIRYRFRTTAEGLDAVPAPEDPAWPAPPPAVPPATAPPAGLAFLDVLPSSPPAVAKAVPLRLTVTAEGGPRSVEANVPRKVMERLVLGRRVDLTPGAPLPGLDPAPPPAASSRALLVRVPPVLARPPWEGGAHDVPGEENPLTVAGALARWWSGGGRGGPPVVAGLSEDAPERWQSAPALDGTALLVLPENAFPGRSAVLRERLAKGWTAGPVLSDPPFGALPRMVVLASAEAPGILGRRLHLLSRLPALKGRYLMVWSLSGPLRPDLPADLLAGGVAAVGVVAVGPSDRFAAPERLIDFGKRVAAAGGRRPEQMGPVPLWVY